MLDNTMCTLKVKRIDLRLTVLNVLEVMDIFITWTLAMVLQGMHMSKLIRM